MPRAPEVLSGFAERGTLRFLHQRNCYRGNGHVGGPAVDMTESDGDLLPPIATKQKSIGGA